MRLSLIILCLLFYVFEKYKNGANAYMVPVCGEKGIVCEEKVIHVFTKCDKPSCKGYKICKLIYALRNIFLSHYISVLEQIFESLSDEGDGGYAPKPICKSKDPTLVQRTIGYWLGDRKFSKQKLCKADAPIPINMADQCKKPTGRYKCMLAANYTAMVYSLYTFICSFYKRICPDCVPPAWLNFENTIIEKVGCLMNQFLLILHLKSNDEEECSCDDESNDGEECECDDEGGFVSKLLGFLKSVVSNPTPAIPANTQ
ncbi:uncharacterized protein LOC108743056 [Agrilus planipennis]|uniref:Uncharacterized protein LOC108743056 n=1 Tax=Agrilus planipennis TaxID=224129 RepID=A0A1W4XMG4_AGRPL|nr:uncharacterized protein LOC108743056 [Agrilus planipennis]